MAYLDPCWVRSNVPQVNWPWMLQGTPPPQPRGIPLCFAFGSGVLKDALGDAAATSREQSVGFKVLKLNLTNNSSRGESHCPPYHLPLTPPHLSCTLLSPSQELSCFPLTPFSGSLVQN